MENKFLDAALQYSTAGFSVIPTGTNKKPLITWARFQHERADEAQIRAWWKKWPTANVGVVTGEISGLTVLDIDSEEGQDAVISALNGRLPETPYQTTPRGGQHLVFQYTPKLQTRAGVLPGCDIRNDGGYVLVAPSRGANGKPYEWVYSILQGGGAPFPESLLNAIKSNISRECTYFRGEGANFGQPQGNNGQQKETGGNTLFSEGTRDEQLFHLAHLLTKGGADEATVRNYIHFFAMNCKPPFPEREAEIKIQSALQRAQRRERNLTQELREWAMVTSGNFLVTDAYSDLQVVTKEEKKLIQVALGRFVKNGFLERVGDRNGCYRRVERDLEALNFLNAEAGALEIVLPFGLHNLVELMPGNILLLAGEPNAGKTGLLLNLIRDNMTKYKIHYFNSEMGSGELKKRLSKFDLPLGSWCFQAWERSDRFEDVVKPGEGKLNIIDFLELHDNFYEISGRLAGIHKKLQGAVAVVALQKNPGSDVGLGGYRSLEKPRLALAMGQGVLKIVKAKNWKTTVNPNGKTINFKLVDGCRFLPQGDWH